MKGSKLTVPRNSTVSDNQNKNNSYDLTTISSRMWSCNSLTHITGMLKSVYHVTSHMMLLYKEMLYLYKQVHYVCGQSVAHKWQTPLTFPQVHHAILPANSSFDLHSEAHFFAN